MGRRYTSYTAVEIWDAYGSGDALLAIGDDEDLRRLLANSLSRVPRSVADKVIAKCAFMRPLHRGQHAETIPLHHTKGRVIILLSAYRVRHPESEKSIKAVLHEVAHLHKKHNISGIWMSPEEYERVERVEREARALGDYWFNASGIHED